VEFIFYSEEEISFCSKNKLGARSIPCISKCFCFANGLIVLPAYVVLNRPSPDVKIDFK
jgi:hypothetical protein